MTFAEQIGPVTTDQDLLLPIIDRAITACVRGTLVQEDATEAKAVAAILYWLENGPASGRIEIDFPRRLELMAMCAVETHKRFLRERNAWILRRAVDQRVA